MIEELINYKGTFAKKLLTFIWQFGRSLKVKTLIAGQNLQPSVFSMKINDIANCAYIALYSGKTANRSVLPPLSKATAKEYDLLFMKMKTG